MQLEFVVKTPIVALFISMGGDYRITNAIRQYLSYYIAKYYKDIRDLQTSARDPLGDCDILRLPLAQFMKDESTRLYLTVHCLRYTLRAFLPHRYICYPLSGVSLEHCKPIATQ